MIAQQTACRQNHSRLAEPALRHVFLQPRLLTGMTRVLGQSFDRHEIASLRLARGNLAGADRLPLLEDRARTANAHAAAKFRPGQRERVPQHPDQRRVIIDIRRALGAVDGEADFTHGRAGFCLYSPASLRRR